MRAFYTSQWFGCGKSTVNYGNVCLQIQESSYPKTILYPALCLHSVQLYFAISLKINKSMLRYKLMNKWRITKTVWPNYSISSSWVRNSTYVSSLPAFACVCSLKACFLVITVITHFNGWLDLSDFCKFNEMPNRESTRNTVLFLLKNYFFPHLICTGV